MKNKSITLIILFISTIGLATSVYFKYIKSYSDEKLQVETTNSSEDISHRQLKLGEAIAMLEELEELKTSARIESTENKVVFKHLKTTNTISTITLAICLLASIWSIKHLRE